MTCAYWTKQRHNIVQNCISDLYLSCGNKNKTKAKKQTNKKPNTSLVNKDKQKEKEKKYFIYQSMTHQSSFILFWRMVPVRPMRTLHFKDFMVWVIWDLGFLILCTSSTMTADHPILHSKKKKPFPLIDITYLITSHTQKLMSVTCKALIITIRNKTYLFLLSYFIYTILPTFLSA